MSEVRVERHVVTFLECADPFRGGLRRRWLSRPARGSRLGTFRRGRGRVAVRWRCRPPAKRRWAGHVRGGRKVGHGRAGEGVIGAGGVNVRVEDARVVVVVPAREEDGLVGRAGLRATDADLRAGRVELGAAEGHGEVQRDDLVSDEIVPCRYVRGESHRDRFAVHWSNLRVTTCSLGRDERGELYVLTSCWYQVVPSDFLPIWSILKNWAVEPLY
jgi:hypothetical protein